MIDFNHEEVIAPRNLAAEKDELRAKLLDRLEPVLETMLPAGRVRNGKFLVGDVLGSPGDSLEVVLTGKKAGLWTDRETGEGGDIFALVAGNAGLDVRTQFAEVVDVASTFVGRSIWAPTPKKSKQTFPVDELGPATAKWDYLDAQGSLIGAVYRYDPPGRKKEFRPWDARRRKMAPPEPRPLYNQPGMANAQQVVLVEGEKCAQALIEVGVVATTAMHGANAPPSKTDWSPLKGKDVLIWPDKDKPGWEYASQVGQALLSSGANSCYILSPPNDVEEGWDAADALKQGFDAKGLIASGPRLQVKPMQVSLHGDEADSLFPGTEDSLARAFTKAYHEDWRYVAGWGNWLIWDTNRWRTEGTLGAIDLVRGICRGFAQQEGNPRLANKVMSSKAIAGIERLARTDRKHAGTVDEWDADQWILNTPGGIVDLHTGKTKPHDKSERVTKITTASPKGECPTWLTFLNDVTGGDVELQKYLQLVSGYTLTGSTQEHALFFLYGTGANGKSVFVNTLTTILGDYATNAPMDTFMETKSERHPTDMAGLRGARFVAAIETEQGKSWAESKVKSLTGGDKISARFMRQDFFEFTPQFKLIVAGNHKPAIKNVDEAMRRRVHLIPFTITVPPERRDPDLQKKLLAERDGILAWSLQGCLEWQRMGKIEQPQKVREATDEYFVGEDVMGRWLEERCILDVNAKSLTAELFKDWKSWADAAGEFIGSQKRFSGLLTTKGVDKWKNSGGLRGFQGIRLKHPVEPFSTSYDD